MRFSLHIAWRYLFAPKSHNAINIVSGVSAAGVAVATAALVCVLSVMNGFNRVIESLFSQFDPELLILPTEGKYFQLDSPEILQLRQNPSIAVFSPIVRETAMVDYKDHQVPAQVMGVDSSFQSLCQIDSIITDGYFQVHDGAFDRCVLGRGLAQQLGVNAHFVGAIHLWAPKRIGKVNLMRPDESLLKETSYIAGTFAVNQMEYDNQLIIISLSAARRLFQYSPDQATAIELRLTSGTSVKQAKKQIHNLLGDAYQVLDKYEQQADFYRIAKMEKWLCALLLAFILMIASFNIIGSLSMLMLEKTEDIAVFRNLGATPKQVRQIFLVEGWLVSLLGATIGLAIGLILCLLQEHFGIIKLGNGYDYVLSAYPVAVQFTDLLLISAIVISLGFLAAWYPTHHLRTDNN